MRQFKFIGLFVIFLIISLNFVPAVNNSAINSTNSDLNDSLNESLNNNTLNNTSSLNNTTSFNPNLISLSLPVEWTTFNVPGSGLTDLMSLKVGFMDKPTYVNPKWSPPGWNPPGVYHGWKVWKTIADLITYACYAIGYGIQVASYAIYYALQVVAAGVVFFGMMVAWFFTTIAWVFYAICCMIAYAPHVGDTFKLFGFGFDLTHHKTDYMSYRNISFLNNSNNTNTTIKPNIIEYNDTNGSNNSSENTTIEEVNIPNTSTYNGNLTQFLILNNYSSGSGEPYENATNTELQAKLSEYNHQNKSITGSISFINTLFEGINNIITIVGVIVKIIDGVSALLSAPTSGGSLTAAVGSEAANEGSKVTVSSIIKEALKKILGGIIVEAVTTSIIGAFSEQDYSNEHVGVAVSKLGSRVYIDRYRLYGAMTKITSTKEKFNGFDGVSLGFGIIRDLVGVACTVSTMLTELTFDSYSNPIQKELEYRNNNSLTIK